MPGNPYVLGKMFQIGWKVHNLRSKICCSVDGKWNACFAIVFVGKYSKKVSKNGEKWSNFSRITWAIRQERTQCKVIVDREQRDTNTIVLTSLCCCCGFLEIHAKGGVATCEWTGHRLFMWNCWNSFARSYKGGLLVSCPHADDPGVLLFCSTCLKAPNGGYAVGRVLVDDLSLPRNGIGRAG